MLYMYRMESLSMQAFRRLDIDGKPQDFFGSELCGRRYTLRSHSPD